MVFDGELQYHNHIWTIEIYYQSVINFEMIQRLRFSTAQLIYVKIIHANITFSLIYLLFEWHCRDE